MEKDPRVTRLGSFLRDTGIDEIPQLWNILKGEMSLIGPRPLDALDPKDCRQMTRLKVKPGVTGLWQVKGHERLNFRCLLKWDQWYIGHRSLALDFFIILQTCFYPWRTVKKVNWENIFNISLDFS